MIQVFTANRAAKYLARLFIVEDKKGVTAIEYGLIASLIAVVIITAATLVGTESLDRLQHHRHKFVIFWSPVLGYPLLAARAARGQTPRKGSASAAPRTRGRDRNGAGRGDTLAIGNSVQIAGTVGDLLTTAGDR